jgi:Ni/Co efflux regulator RcnB
MSEVSRERNKDYRHKGLMYIRQHWKKGRRLEIDGRREGKGRSDHDAHACNLSYSRGRDWEDQGLRLAPRK